MSAPSARGGGESLKFTWIEDLGDIKPSAREVLEKYSKIAPADVMPHVYAIRERAWAIFPYPCIGMGRFIDMALYEHFDYPEVLQRLKNTEQKQTFLDIGCAFAQDLRRFVVDGVDSSQLYGSDLELDFINMSYDLFKDRDTLKTRFFKGDVFNADSDLKQLDGKINIVGANLFFHLFDILQQKIVAKRILKLLTSQKDNLIVGRQAGASSPGSFEPVPGQGFVYLHSEDSWKAFWQELGAELNMTFEVKAKMFNRYNAEERKKISQIFGADGNHLEWSVRVL